MTKKEAERDTCKSRWLAHKNGRMKDVRAIFAARKAGESSFDSEEADLFSYGLSFDYVATGTFQGQRVGYWRWQFSWGGPSDEVRFYGDLGECPHRVEYVFMDWFDGHARKLQGADEALMLDAFSEFDDVDAVSSEYRKAHED